MAQHDDNRPDATGDQESTDSRSPVFPEPPDLARVGELRSRIRQDQAARDTTRRRRGVNDDFGRRARDIGGYTLIPMLMIAGPVVGYLLGDLIQKRWGGEPWPGVVGALFGLVAGFRQVFLLLARKQQSRDGSGGNGDH